MSSQLLLIFCDIRFNEVWVRNSREMYYHIPATVCWRVMALLVLRLRASQGQKHTCVLSWQKLARLPLPRCAPLPQLDLNSMVYYYTITGSKTMSLSWASSWLCHRFEPIVRPVSFYQYRSYRNRSLYVRSLIPSVSYPSPHRTMAYGGRMNVHIL